MLSPEAFFTSGSKELRSPSACVWETRAARCPNGSRRQRSSPHASATGPRPGENEMKLTIIGGAGTRVPLVVVGLVRFHDQLRTDELALWDPNRERQALIARLCDAMAQRYGVPLKIRAAGNAEDAVSGADFIISSIRVGGGSVRIMDERIALEHNVLGQETVGPGGWAMALRSF